MLAYQDEPLAHDTVEHGSDAQTVRTVGEPQLLATRHQSPQLPLWAMGDHEWLKAFPVPSMPRRRTPTPLEQVEQLSFLDMVS